MSDNKKILFLDDMEERHKAFKRVLQWRQGLDFTYVYTAADAIAALNANHFDQAFLDHDLSLEDIMAEPGDPNAKVPTGMTVVDHILTMARPPGMVCVHSCNGPAATEMVARLKGHPAYSEISLSGEYFYAMQVPFPHLITQLL